MDEWERKTRDHQRQRNLIWTLEVLNEWERAIFLLANRLGVGWGRAFNEGWELGSEHGKYHAVKRERERIKETQEGWRGG